MSIIIFNEADSPSRDAATAQNKKAPYAYGAFWPLSKQGNLIVA
jgi:hypothetical protein